MRRLKILHFPLHDPFGGVDRYILGHWRWMDHSRFEFHLITRYLPDQYFLAQVDNATVIPVLGRVAGREQEFFQEIEKIIDQGHYDCIHLHTSHWCGGFPLEEIAVKKKIPRIIVHAHSTGIDPCFTGKPLELLLAQHQTNKSRFKAHLATDFWSCSRLAAGWIFPDSIPRDQIQILYNAVDLDIFKYNPVKRIEIRTKLGIGDELVIGTVGRLTDQKNPFFLLEIFKAVHQLNPNVRLLWIGEGIHKEELARKAADLGDRVIFLGNRPDVADLLQGMDGFLLPSLFEGLPIVGVEAQGAGLPCFFADTIANEFPIETLSNFLPLDMSPSEWAQKILKTIQNTPRTDTRSLMTTGGYDLRTQAKVLENRYLGESV